MFMDSRYIFKVSPFISGLFFLSSVIHCCWDYNDIEYIKQTHPIVYIEGWIWYCISMRKVSVMWNYICWCHIMEVHILKVSGVNLLRHCWNKHMDTTINQHIYLSKYQKKLSNQGNNVNFLLDYGWSNGDYILPFYSCNTMSDWPQ